MKTLIILAFAAGIWAAFMFVFTSEPTTVTVKVSSNSNIAGKSGPTNNGESNFTGISMLGVTQKGGLQKGRCFDFNHDKLVTTDDISFVAAKFGVGRRDRNYIGKYDITHDGFIDISDIVMIAGQVGQKCK